MSFEYIEIAVVARNRGGRWWPDSTDLTTESPRHEESQNRAQAHIQQTWNG